MNIPINPMTDLSLVSLKQSPGREILENTIKEYLNFLRRQPTFCGTAEQQDNLTRHVAQGHELIKLIAAERLKITREIDHQKQEWMEIEKELTAPIIAAMQPIKEAVEHYNREVLRVREHQQIEADQQNGGAESGETNWFSPNVVVPPLPKGVQMKWAFEITDPNQVPNGYWIIDEAAVKAAVADGLHDIPGVRVYQEPTMTYRK